MVMQTPGGALLSPVQIWPQASTSKSLKINNLGGFMEVSAERIAQIIREVDGNHTMGAAALADAITQELEKERPPSDLEVVQKALDQSRLDLCCKYGKIYLYNDVGEPASHIFGSAGDFLTWAKQTIGVE